MEHTRIFEIICAVVEEFNFQQPAESKLGTDPSTVLVGPSGVLDSLGLVTLMIAFESRLLTDLNVTVLLLDENALADASGPLRTLGSLVDHVISQL